MKSLAYLANARLPTEKAHGLQICKMCEAFAASGLDVNLLHPFRHQANAALKSASVFEYYGIKQNFAVRAVGKTDFLPFVEKYIPFLAQLFAVIQGIVWGFFAVCVTKGRKFDRYYTRDIYCAVWLRIFGLPFIFECHTIPRKIQKFFLKMIVHAASMKACVVLTSTLAERCEQLGFPAAKIKIHGDAVDLALFADLPSLAKCRAELGLPSEARIIGYIGRFQVMGSEKGIPELIRAWALATKKTKQKIVLLCVGGPIAAAKKYRGLCAELGASEADLLFFDRVAPAQVPKWIRSCDIVTIPWPWTEFSAYFTSPLKLFEYMAAEVPIVASDLPSLRDVLVHKKTAWLVEAGNPAALAAGLGDLLEDKQAASTIAAQARREVESHTWERRAASIISYYG